MTVRIGWDEYEVALLIDACNRIRDNKIDKAECVHKLSNLLRQRAKANGINIDEVFRNENGIALVLIVGIVQPNVKVVVLIWQMECIFQISVSIALTATIYILIV